MPHRIAPVLAIAALALTLTARPPMAEQASRQEVRGQGKNKPLVSLAGPETKIEGRSYHRLSTAGEFQGLYMRHLGHKPEEFDEYYNPHGVPIVNFERCMVIAIFQGDSVNSAGVYVYSVEENDERILVRYDDRSYQTSGGFREGNPLVDGVPDPDKLGDGGGRRVRAWGMFVLPVSSKAVVLEENVQGIIGQPPEWEERHRFDAPPK